MSYHHYIREQKRLISENRWSEMTVYDKTSEADYSIIRQIIQYKLLRVEPFTQEVLDTYDRLFGRMDGVKWATLISHMLPPPPLSTIRFINHQCDIDWNTSNALTHILLRVLTISDRNMNMNDYLDYLLSKGANINLQSSIVRQSVLYSYIVTSLQTLDPHHVQKQQQIVDCVIYLLEHGADPLVPDRNGVTILSLLEDGEYFHYVDLSLKERLVTLLQAYC